MKLLSILIGGGIGSLLRYITSVFSYRILGSSFPWGTFAVNMIGAILIGFLWGISEKFIISPNTRAFVFVGVLGGFTTFSSYALESFNLFREGEMKIAIINVLAQNILGLALVLAGFIASKYLLKII